MQNRLAMRERSAFDVLTTQSYRRTVDNKRSERERFGMTPVYAAGVAHRVSPPSQSFRQSSVRLYRLRPREQLFVQRDELVGTRICNVARRELLLLVMYGVLVS